MEKVCNSCKISKDISFFHKDSQKKGGYNNKCKNCKTGKEDIKKYNYVVDNKKLCKQCNVEKDLDCFQPSKRKNGTLYIRFICKECDYSNRKTEEYKIKAKSFKSKSPEYMKEYKKDNIRYKEQQLAYSRSSKRRVKVSEWNKNQYNNNPTFKLISLLRNRLYYALTDKGYHKNKKTIDVLGDSIDNVKKFIESKFEEGMTWDNHGEWHVDHKIPLASAQSEKEVYDLCHYSNLQPLWSFDNLSKGSKVLEYYL